MSEPSKRPPNATSTGGSSSSGPDLVLRSHRQLRRMLKYLRTHPELGGKLAPLERALEQASAQLLELARPEAVGPGADGSAAVRAVRIRAHRRLRKALRYVRTSPQLRGKLPRLERSIEEAARRLQVGALDTRNRTYRPRRVSRPDDADLDVLMRPILAQWSSGGPKVSAVIPCFNYGKYVGEAVGSLLRQSYPNLEVLVVDDGSTDGKTPAVCDALASDRVRIVHQRNQGLATARNNGAKLTSGELLVFLDADDLLHPHAIALLLDALARNPDKAYAYSFQRFFGDENMVWMSQEFDASDLAFGNHPSVTALIRREAFERVRGYRPEMVYGYEDWEHWIALASVEHFGVCVRMPLFRHRRHGVTMTHTAHERRGFLLRTLVELNPSVYSPAWLARHKKASRPGVSVIIPFYNGHKYVDETLACLWKQTTDDFEVILVDDGSEDPEARACLERLRGEPRIRILHAPHRGLPSARNLGVAAARAEVVYFLDSDDLIERHTLEVLVVAAALHPEHAFFYGGVRHFGDIEGVCIDAFDRDRLLAENYLTASCLIRRDAYIDAGGMDEHLLHAWEDYDFWLRLVGRGYTGLCLPEILFHYRRHSKGNLAKLNTQRSPEELTRLLRARHEGLYVRGGVTTSTGSYVVAVDPQRDAIARAFEHLEAGIPWRSYRRANLPSLFEPARWESATVNVLYLVPHMLVGGAEVIDLQILAGLRARGHHVTLVACEEAEHVWRDRFEAVSDAVFVLPSLRTDEAGERRFLEYLLISRAIDVVFVRNANAGYGMLRVIRERTRDVAVVDLLHVHNYGLDWVERSAAFNDLLSRRFVITEDLRDYTLRRHGLEADRFQVIYNGIDTSRFGDAEAMRQRRAALRLELGIDDDVPLVGFSGRLSAQKDPIRWVECADRLAKTRTDVRFVMIGAGELEDEVDACIARSPALGGRITRLGYRADAAELLAGLDVLLLVSRYEGLPQVVLEALVHGVPFVSTDVGGTRECLLEDIGTLVPLNAADADIADATSALLERRRANAELGGLCRSVVERRFGLARQQQEYAEAIEAVARPLSRKRRMYDYVVRLLAEPVVP